VSRDIKFVGVWDTVGVMGIPVFFIGLFDDDDEFYDTKIGKNVRIARRALAIDEHRSNFDPAVWKPQDNMDFCNKSGLRVHTVILVAAISPIKMARYYRMRLCCRF
jgi:hypothetical protein